MAYPVELDVWFYRQNQSDDPLLVCRHRPKVQPTVFTQAIDASGDFDGKGGFRVKIDKLVFKRASR